MLISVDRLEQYLDWIGRRRRFVSLPEAIAHYDDGQAAGEPLAALTFDDGYRDIYEHAFPMLQRKGIPFTVFVVTNLMGTDRLLLHDELYLLLRKTLERWRPRGRTRPTELLGKLGIAQRHRMNKGDAFALTRALIVALPQKEIVQIIEALRTAAGPVENAGAHRLLNWKMIKEMHDAGVTIGSHSASHALLGNETQEKVTAEIMDSKREIEARLGSETACFAYPDGSFNHEVVAALAQAGYKAACTTGSHRDPDYPELTVPRRELWQNAGVNARGRASPVVLECLLDGVFDIAKKCREHET